MSPRPAYVDEHSRRLTGVGVEQAYTAAAAYAERLARSRAFSVIREDPPRVVTLAGRHPFARYEIDLRVEGDAHGSTVTVVSWADFPGLHGRLYRLAVIGSRGHVLAVRRMLASIAARAQSSRT